MALAIVQSVANADGTVTASYSTTIAATGAGRLLVAFVFTAGGSAEHVSSVSDGSTNFAHFGEQSGTAGSATVTYDCYYLLSSAAGKTSITVNYTAPNGSFKWVGIYEVSGFTTPATDGSNQLIGTAGTTGGFDMTGPALTPSTAAGFMAAFLNPDNAVVQNPKTGNDFSSGGTTTAGGGIVSLLNGSIASHTPVWTGDTSGQNFTSMVVSFKETATAGNPFNGSAGPVPGGRRQPNVGSADPLKLNLRSQDKQFGAAGQFKAYDYPNPKGRPFPSDLRNFFDPSEVWLFGTDKQFAGPGQFKSYDYPNPKGPRRSIDLLTWTSNGLTSRLPTGAVAAPFFQSEFLNPRGPRAASDNRGFVGFYVIDDNAPFVPVAFDNPRGRQRSIDLLTAATSNALATLLGVAVAVPFAQTDYPNPRGPRAASDLRTWLQGAITAAQPVPFVPVEFANPRTAGRAVDLRSWLISLQGSTLAPIAAVPFSQRDWPNPRGRAYPVDLRGFLNAMEAQLIGKDKMFGAAGEVPAYDWQNPIRLKRLPLSYVQNWLTYAPDQIYFRRTQFYRLGGRGPGRR